MKNVQKKKKTWLQITLTMEPILVDAVSDFLMGVTGAGVEISVDDHLAGKTVNGFLEKESLSDEKTGEILEQLQNHLMELADIFQVEVPTFTTTVLEEEDWGSNWKKHFKPFVIVPGLVIAPTWEEYKTHDDEKVIVMDPGMAFGTGHHATTMLSLQLLQEIVMEKEDQEVLDVGTGTGILGMASALMGAGSVLGIDNDPDAVEAAQENVVFNDLQDVMEVSIASLASLDGSYNLVIANIVHDVLLSLKDDLSRLTISGGALILSGILVGEQAENIIRRFGESGFQLKDQRDEKEWCALLFEK